MNRLQRLSAAGATAVTMVVVSATTASAAPTPDSIVPDSVRNMYGASMRVSCSSGTAYTIKQGHNSPCWDTDHIRFNYDKRRVAVRLPGGWIRYYKMTAPGTWWNLPNGTDIWAYNWTSTTHNLPPLGSVLSKW